MTTPKVDDIAQVLRGHWTTGTWLKADDTDQVAYCVVGAACKVIHDDPEWFEHASIEDSTTYYDGDYEEDYQWFSGLAKFLIAQLAEHRSRDLEEKSPWRKFWLQVDIYEADDDPYPDPLQVIYVWNDSIAGSDEAVIEMLQRYEATLSRAES